MSHPTILAIFHQDVGVAWCCVTRGLLYLAAGVAERPWPSLRSCCRDMMWTLPTLSSCPTGTSALPQSQDWSFPKNPKSCRKALPCLRRFGTCPASIRSPNQGLRRAGRWIVAMGAVVRPLVPWKHGATGCRMPHKFFKLTVPIDWGNYWAWQNFNPIQSTYCRVLGILFPLFFWGGGFTLDSREPAEQRA